MTMMMPAAAARMHPRSAGLTLRVRSHASRPALRVRAQQQQEQFDCAGNGGASTDMRPELKEAITTFIQENKVVLFMKGTRDMPKCGFSKTVVTVLNNCSVPYETVDILADDMLRTGMKEFSQWPTFPQLYVAGEFYGGCDITVDAYHNGELAEDLEVAFNE
ncbi:hypothetical protein PPROV_000512900 [Pycnococcus provasolii]|uniref:Glutaredoxin domain-containing protein n=1 Tax=Pycnococcus provasolii TaxID=41880 RepID=A0A830HH00_9CHLO|nr:hypothetical protein PPROV_000512900 [Pycnococcus provasolii]